MFDLYGINKYFKESIVSGDIHMRKPEKRIFHHVVKHMQCDPQKCIFVDNSVRNLNAAQESVGMNVILFNRDHEAYSGDTVNDFLELDGLLRETYFYKLKEQ